MSSNWGTSDSYNVLGVAKSGALEGAGSIGVRYSGRLDIALEASQTQLTRNLAKLANKNGITFGEEVLTSSNSRFIKRMGSRLVAGSSKAELSAMGEALEAALKQQLPQRIPWKAIVNVRLNPLLSEAVWGGRLSRSGFKAFKFAFGPALDAGAGGYFQYLEDRNNPYLTPWQKGFRIGIAGGGSALTVVGIGAAIGCGGTVVCGVVVGVTGFVTWNVIGQPLIFKFPALQPADRKLEPI